MLKQPWLAAVCLSLSCRCEQHSCQAAEEPHPRDQEGQEGRAGRSSFCLCPPSSCHATPDAPLLSRLCARPSHTSCSSWATRAVPSWPAPWPTSSRRSRPTPWPPTTSPWCVHPHTTSSFSIMNHTARSSLRRTRRLLTTRGGGGAGERPGPGHLQGQGRRRARGLQQV